MWPTKQKAIVLNQSLTLLYLPLILFQVREWELQFSEKYTYVGEWERSRVQDPIRNEDELVGRFDKQGVAI